MKIIADANLKDIEHYFSQFGELTLLPGRKISAETIADADVLLIRSVTKVDSALLEGSNISFVGTATSGTDHIDQEYLAGHRIAFAHAHGSNAQAVADYCISALHGFDCVKNKRIGIVGLGAVGSALARALLGQGCKVIAYDPLLTDPQRQRALAIGVEFTDAIAEIFSMEAVSLHTPLSFDGKYPSHHMIERSLLDRLPQKAVLINASRGGIIREPDLAAFLQSRADVNTVLDVWHDEPDINIKLMNLSAIATPHIAGYSQRAKTLATKMLADCFAEFFEANTEQLSMPSAATLTFKELGSIPSDVDAVKSAVLRALPLADWSSSFKQQMLASSDRSETFDKFRKSMINRGEFSDFKVYSSALTPESASALSGLGFSVV